MAELLHVIYCVCRLRDLKHPLTSTSLPSPTTHTPSQLIFRQRRKEEDEDEGHVNCGLTGIK